MISTFLQVISANPQNITFSSEEAGLIAGLFAFIVAFAFFMIIIAIAIYVYASFAYMEIAKKTGVGPAGIAWIPIVGKPLLSAKIAKMHWWPILLLAIFWIPFIGSIAAIVFLVFMIIWSWKVFERVGRPGWWSIFYLIYIIFLVFLGVAAWGGGKKRTNK